MASLYRPNSMVIWDPDKEDNISVHLRVEEGADQIVFAVLGTHEPYLDDQLVPVENVLSLILDLVTAVQVAMENSR